MAGKSIPRVASYDVREAAGGLSSVEWRIQVKRAVLLVHDAQEYFVRAYGGEEPLPTVLRNMKQLTAAARAVGVPAVYTVQAPSKDTAQRGLLRDFWGPGMGSDREDAEVVRDVAPMEGDLVLPKAKYSAFFRTDLERALADMGRDQLVICGVYAHIGCLATAADALMRDVQAFLVADAVAAFSAEQHAWALRHAGATCARVMDADSVLAELDAGEPLRATKAAGTALE